MVTKSEFNNQLSCVRKIDIVANYAREPALSLPAARRATFPRELFSRADGCFFRLVFHADDETLADSAHAVGVDGFRIVGD
jgi:hypothetical protein